MDPIKRVAIFVFYNKNGNLTKATEFLIVSLKQVVDKLIIVINGQIKNYEKVEQLSDHFIIRKNAGYDAGAYKDALFHAEVKKIMEDCQELVLCNDTFFGPFISFQELWKQMSGTNVDFWGLNLSDNGLFTFLQSYFLVFKRKTWSALIQFFNEEIDGDTLDFKKVLDTFEKNLFLYMRYNGYSYGAYCLQKYHVFNEVDGSICYDRLPILKKKVFSERYYNETKIMNALSFIDHNYCYDIGLILNDVKEENSVCLLYDDIKKHKINICASKMIVTKARREDIIAFSVKFCPIYIYGIGKYSKLVREILEKDKIAGFIVSDDQKHPSIYEGYYVYVFSDFKHKMDRKVPILVALGEKNKRTVEKTLCDFENILYLF